MSIAALDKSLSKTRLSVARKTQQRLFILMLILDDILALSLAYAFAYLIRFQSGLPFFDDVAVSHDEHLWLSVALLPLWLIVFAFFHLYNIHYLLGGTQEYARVFNASGVLLTLVIITTFLRSVDAAAIRHASRGRRLQFYRAPSKPHNVPVTPRVRSLPAPAPPLGPSPPRAPPMRAKSTRLKRASTGMNPRPPSTGACAQATILEMNVESYRRKTDDAIMAAQPQ